MGVFKNYVLNGSTLILTESLHWAFQPNQEAIRVWTLHNYDKYSITSQQLDELIQYDEDIDTEIIEREGYKGLQLYLNFSNRELYILSEDITSETRQYNTAELTEIILNLQQQFSEDKSEIRKYHTFNEHLKLFLENEKVKKERILQQLSESNAEAVLKAKAKLDLLVQLINMVTAFEKE